MTKFKDLVLVAGGSGMLGREVVATLKVAGWRVRVLSRSIARARALEGVADEIGVGDAMQPNTLGAAFAGVTHVVSAVGAPVSFGFRQRAGYLEVDTIANGHLIAAAERADVARFVYVGVHPAPGYDQTAYVRAHERVGDRLRGSGLSFGIVQPTGLFPVFDAFVHMARRGFCSIPGGGEARTNPVHPLDVADACRDALNAAGNTVVSIGGPDVLSRQQIVEMAFHAVGVKPRIAHLPPALFIGAGRALHPLHRRLGELLDFAARAFTNNSVAPALGHRRLEDYFATLGPTRSIPSRP